MLLSVGHSHMHAPLCACHQLHTLKFGQIATVCPLTSELSPMGTFKPANEWHIDKPCETPFSEHLFSCSYKLEDISTIRLEAIATNNTF